MSQIASFTYIRESDVPFLGFWSKPQRRLFGKAEDKFGEYLTLHKTGEVIFKDCDGVYVALVLAFLQLKEPSIEDGADPVIQTVRKQVSGSHWLLNANAAIRVAPISEPITQSSWVPFLQSLGCNASEFSLDFFDRARGFVVGRILDIKPGEALLISVG